VITELHAPARGRLDARVRAHSADRDAVDASHAELVVEIRAGEGAVHPMFLDDDVAALHREIGMELGAPGAAGERPHADRAGVRRVHEAEGLEVTLVEAMMRREDDLDLGLARRLD